MKLNNKKILITGANGFVGTRLIERLYVEYNASITALVRNLGRSTRIGRMKIHIVRGDILDTQLVQRLTREADIVVNLVLGGKKAIIEGTKNIARFARFYGVERFVHMSSAAVYGRKAGENHVTEDAPVKKTGHWYTDSKIVAENIINRETKKGLRSVILRPRVVWGPYSFWVTDFYKQIHNDTFYLVDNGEGACNTIFIDNLIDSIFLSVSDERAIGETYFVTDDEKITWKRFYETWAGFLREDIKFESINSGEYYASQKRRSKLREIMLFATSPTMRDFVVNAPVVNNVALPFLEYIYNLPDEKKQIIKRLIGYNDSSKYIIPVVNPLPSIDERKVDRESGKGFTSIEKIKNTLGYRPGIDFAKGSKITLEWLKFAGFVDR